MKQCSGITRINLYHPGGRFSSDTAAYTAFFNDYISFRNNSISFFQYAKAAYPGTYVTDHLESMFVQPEVNDFGAARDVYFKTGISMIVHYWTTRCSTGNSIFTVLSHNFLHWLILIRPPMVYLLLQKVITGALHWLPITLPRTGQWIFSGK